MIETMLLTFWLASGTIRETPLTHDECFADLHVLSRWARVIEIRKGGRLEFAGDAVVATACVPIVLDPCEAQS